MELVVRIWKRKVAAKKQAKQHSNSRIWSLYQCIYNLVTTNHYVHYKQKV